MSVIKKDKIGRTIDPFCWKCHRIGTKVNCSLCPKSFHLKCLITKPPNTLDWVCYECVSIMKAENVDERFQIFYY